MTTLLMLTDGSIFGNSMAVPLVAPLCSGFQCCVDHGLCVEVGRRLTAWEVGEGIGVLLDDGSSWQHGPQLLAGVDRVGRRSMCCSNGSTRRFTGRGIVGRSRPLANQSSLTWKCTFQLLWRRWLKRVSLQTTRTDASG